MAQEDGSRVEVPGDLPTPRRHATGGGSVEATEVDAGGAAPVDPLRATGVDAPAALPIGPAAATGVDAPARPRRRPGAWRGLVWISPDFDDPVPGFPVDDGKPEPNPGD